MSAVMFDASTHRYTVDGEVLPHVTQIIAPLIDYSAVPRDVLERKRELGVAIHLAAELDDRGELDEATVDAAVAPYLAAWRTFRATTQAEIVAIEDRLAHPSLRYAGTLDRTALLTTSAGRRAWLLDIKSSPTIEPWVGVQLAAYRMLLEANGRSVDAVGAVQLLPDGSHRLVEFGHPDDARCFVGLLAVHQWRSKHARNHNG